MAIDGLAIEGLKKSGTDLKKTLWAVTNAIEWIKTK
jgi:hypothetical protein